MSTIEHVAYNKDKKYLYMICTTGLGLRYFIIVKVNPYDLIYTWVNKIKDTNYKLENPTDISINSVTYDIAISDYNFIRIYSGDNYKYIKTLGSIGALDINSSNSDERNTENTTPAGTAFRVVGHGLRSLWCKSTGYNFTKITGIKYSIDGKTIYVVDSIGVYGIDIEKNVKCPIYVFKFANKSIKLRPYKLNIIDNDYIIVSFAKEEEDKCSCLKLINVNTSHITDIIFNFNTNKSFDWFDIIEKKLYLYKRDNYIVVVDLQLALQSGSENKPFYITTENSELFPIIKTDLATSIEGKNNVFLCIDKTNIFVVNDNNIIKYSINNNTFVYDSPVITSNLFLDYGVVISDPRLRKNLKKKLKSRFNNKNNNISYNNHHVKLNFNIKETVYTHGTTTFKFDDDDKAKLTILLDKNSAKAKAKAAYKQLSLKFHPDKCSIKPVNTNSTNIILYNHICETIFKEITLLYNTLHKNKNSTKKLPNTLPNTKHSRTKSTRKSSSNNKPLNTGPKYLEY